MRPGSLSWFSGTGKSLPAMPVTCKPAFSSSYHCSAFQHAELEDLDEIDAPERQVHQ